MSLSLRVPTLRAQSAQALLTGSPGALALQLETAEDEAFADEMRSPSIVSVAAVACATMVGTMETRCIEPSKEPTEASNHPEAKELKRRCRVRKEQKQSGRSQPELHLLSRSRDDSDSTDEGEGKGNDDMQSGSRNVNR